MSRELGGLEAPREGENAMDQKEAKKRAFDLVKSCDVFVLSTVDGGNRPHSRLMGTKLVEKDMTIYMEAHTDSKKMGQIEKNPRAQLLFAAKDYSEVVTLSGKATLDGSPSIRKRIWEENPQSARYFSRYDDPTLGIIRFEPHELAYYGPSTGTEIIEMKL